LGSRAFSHESVFIPEDSEKTYPGQTMSQENDMSTLSYSSRSTLMTNTHRLSSAASSRAWAISRKRKEIKQ
uniref:Uncharacterized protein n=1 Tax=Sinocyclocheilus rhinocerous TaxID=307959 RepID=A0A673GJ39_9TELE